MNLYVVQNQEGKFLRSIGYGGSGGNWVEKLEKAKFYPKIGQAKSRVTFFYREYPTYGCPKIIEFTLDLAAATIIDMKEITEKSIKKIKRKEVQDKIDSLKRKIARDEELAGVLEKEIAEMKQEMEEL